MKVASGCQDTAAMYEVLHASFRELKLSLRDTSLLEREDCARTLSPTIRKVLAHAAVLFKGVTQAGPTDSTHGDVRAACSFFNAVFAAQAELQTGNAVVDVDSARRAILAALMDGLEDRLRDLKGEAASEESLAHARPCDRSVALCHAFATGSSL
jgi:hypothetical protein